MPDIELALLSAGSEGEAAERWLASLPGVRVRLARSLDALPLADLERIWVHATTVEPTLELIAWLKAGGRLLATLSAAELPYRLGLEPVAADDRRSGVWSPATEEFRADSASRDAGLRHVRGLAAFGPHPLFAGFGNGAFLWPPSEGEPFEWLAYRGTRPERGAGVAVERVGHTVHQARWVAWEYQVGEGGILCLGAFAQLAARDGRLAAELHALLANALTGDAIPHSTRSAVATHWPGLLPEDDESALVPTRAAASAHLDDIWDEWPPTASAILIESPAREERPWSAAGRRVLVTGGERSGVQEIWAHPHRLLRQARILVNGREPVVTVVRLAPDEVVRILRLGEIELTERLTIAADHALVFWSIVADGPATITLRWESDLRRAAPYPARSSQLQVSTVGDAELRLSLSHEPVVAQVLAAAGALAAHGGRMEVVGEGLVRLILAAAGGTAELDRTLDALKRRRLRAFRQERMLFARRIEERLTRLEAPDSALVRDFAWARVRLDRSLADVPGTGRSLLAADVVDHPERARFVSLEACRAAAAALSVGDRDPARDVLRFAARWRDHRGTPPSEVSATGLAYYDDPASPGAVRELVQRWLAWTGDAAFVERLGLGSAPDAATVVPAEPGGPVGVVERVMGELWGVAPDAAQERCAIEPALPDGWNEMSLRRLRIGATLLDLRLRRRPGAVVLRVEKLQGPRLRIVAALRGAAVTAVSLNDEPLGGSRAVFEIADEAEVRWTIG